MGRGRLPQVVEVAQVVGRHDRWRECGNGRDGGGVDRSRRAVGVAVERGEYQVANLCGDGPDRRGEEHGRRVGYHPMRLGAPLAFGPVTPDAVVEAGVEVDGPVDFRGESRAVRSSPPPQEVGAEYLIEFPPQSAQARQCGVARHLQRTGEHGGADPVPVVQIGDADVSCADDGRCCAGDLDSIGDVGGAEGRRLARCLEASAARSGSRRGPAMAFEMAERSGPRGQQHRLSRNIVVGDFLVMFPEQSQDLAARHGCRIG
jgi:hypothetical protein